MTFDVDLHPTGGHGRRIGEEVVNTPAKYAHLPHLWVIRFWRCLTCLEVFESDPFPFGTGLYADDMLQRQWDAHLTPDHPLP